MHRGQVQRLQCKSESVLASMKPNFYPRCGRQLELKHGSRLVVTWEFTFQIRLDARWRHRFGQDHDATLRDPAENDLGWIFPELFCQVDDDWIFNGPARCWYITHQVCPIALSRSQHLGSKCRWERYRDFKS